MLGQMPIRRSSKLELWRASKIHPNILGVKMLVRRSLGEGGQNDRVKIKMNCKL